MASDHADPGAAPLSTAGRRTLAWRLLPSRIPPEWWWAVVLQAILAVPYLIAIVFTFPGSHFGGIVYNPDDPYVYLSWMRQAHDGHWLFRNLFTLEPQRGLSFHLLFALLGWTAAVTGLPLTLVYHLARVILGVCLIVEIAVLLRLLERDPRRRTWMLLFVTLGSGLGWTYFLAGSPIIHPLPNNTHLPTDLWMTETIPFLSLLLNPLFTCAYCLLLGAFLCGLRGERQGSIRWSAAAGVCALALGNIHSYDVLILYPVWATFLLFLTLRPRAAQIAWVGWSPGAAWKRFLVMALIGMPSVAYQYWVLHNEPVFQARALVATQSPPLVYYLMGIGLLLPLAFLQARASQHSPTRIWLLIWCVLAMVLPYVPVSFQWKLAFGLDFPFLVLAAARIAGWIGQLEGSRPDRARLLAWAAIGIALLSNLCFLSSVFQMIAANQSNVFPPLYIPDAEWNAMLWLRAHHQPGDVVLCLPSIGNLAPAYTGDAVYVGHWGETADFGRKLAIARGFFTGSMPPAEAIQFLQANRIRYVYSGIYEQAQISRTPGATDPLPHLPDLTPVYRAGPPSDTVRIYKAVNGR